MRYVKLDYARKLAVLKSCEASSSPHGPCNVERQQSSVPMRLCFL